MSNDIEAMRIADENARAADAAANAVPLPPKPAAPQFATMPHEFHASGMVATERDIQSLVASDQALEDEARALGRIAEADDRRAARAAKIQDWRRSLGVSTPVAIDAETQALNDIGRNPHARASDYYIDLSMQAAAGVSEAGSVEAANWLAAVCAANQLSKETAGWIISAALEAAAASRARTPDERANARADNLRLIEERAGGYVKAKERIELAKAFLSKGGAMPSGVQGVFVELLANDPLVNETVTNLQAALAAHRKGR